MLVTLRKRPSSPNSTTNVNNMIASREQRHLMNIAATEIYEIAQGKAGAQQSVGAEEMPRRKHALAASMRPTSARAQIMRGATQDPSTGAFRGMPRPPAQRGPASARGPRSRRESSAQAPRSPRVPSPRTPSRWQGMHPVLISLAATHYKRECDCSLPVSVMDIVRRRREMFP